MELIYTNDLCTGCNKCVRSCPVLTANIATQEGYVTVDRTNVLYAGNVLMSAHMKRETIMMIRTVFLKTLHRERKFP